MNTKAILGITITAVFAVSMLMAQTAIASAHPDHLNIEATVVDVSKGKLNAAIITTGEIPQDGSEGAFGFGIITGFKNGAPENVLAITTHMCAADHTDQGAGGDCPGGTVGLLTALGIAANEDHDGPEFHSHVLDLKGPTSSCAGFDAEVDLGRTLATGNNVIAEYDLTVVGNGVVVQNVPVSDLHDADVEGIAAFTISGVASGTTITNLCLDLVGVGSGL